MYQKIHSFFRNHYYTNYHNQYQHAKKLFAFDIFLVISALAILAGGLYFYFWNPALTDQIDLKISLGDDRIKSGEAVEISIDYKNRSKYILQGSTLSLHLPDGFIVDRQKTPTTTFNENSTFFLNDLNPGAKGQVSLHGYLWTEPKQDEKISALLSYIPENSKIREQKFSSFLLNLPETILKSELTIATTSFAGTYLPFSYKLTNSSDTKLENLDFEISFPGKIDVANETKLQNISLEKGEEKVITGNILIPNKSDQYNFSIAAMTTINNNYIKLTKTDATIKTFSPDIAISATFKNKPAFAEPGQNLTTTIQWKNNSGFDFANGAIRLSFTPGIVDLRTTANENHLKIEGNDLIVTSEQRTNLGNIKKDSSDEFNINISLLPTFNLGNVENAHLQIKGVFQGELNAQKFSASSETDNIPLSTEITLSAEARYYSNEGDQLGRGPLPPQIGETSKYWIFVRLNNGTNAVRNATFSATLPTGVSFTGKQSVTIGPAISNDGNNLTWNYRELPANTQTGLYFEVAVSPSPEQINKNVDLVKNLKFTATDKTTGKQFDLNKTLINNILPKSDIGSTKGSLVQ